MVKHTYVYLQFVFYVWSTIFSNLTLRSSLCCLYEKQLWLSSKGRTTTRLKIWGHFLYLYPSGICTVYTVLISVGHDTTDKTVILRVVVKSHSHQGLHHSTGTKVVKTTDDESEVAKCRLQLFYKIMSWLSVLGCYFYQICNTLLMLCMSNISYRPAAKTKTKVTID